MKKINFAVLLCFFWFYGIVVEASEAGFVYVTDETSLNECMQDEVMCKLKNDIEVNSAKIINKDLVIDLNGHSIIADPSMNRKSGLIAVGRGVKLTINDTTNTGKISTGPSGNVWAGINLITDNSSEEVAELVVNGGIIEGYYYGVVGNGTLHNTKITINGGTIKGLNESDSVGIYQPQEGELTINGGTITGGTGIEIRSGNLIVNSGTIKGVAPKFIKVVNGSGSTTNGVGIAVAQHTTKKPINIKINDGNISGEYAFYEWNPHKNDNEAISKISMHIYGGEFTGTATGVKAIYSEDFTKFVSGGKFNTKISEYLTEDAKTTAKVIEEDTKLLASKKSNPYIIVLVLLPISIIFGVIILYIYKRGFKKIF